MSGIVSIFDRQWQCGQLSTVTTYRTVALPQVCHFCQEFRSTPSGSTETVSHSMHVLPSTQKTGSISAY